VVGSDLYYLDYPHIIRTVNNQIRKKAHNQENYLTMSKKTRGEQRFGGVTYSQISEWTGLSLSTVQSYGGRRRFNPHDLVGTLRWVAEQCRARGRPIPWEVTEPPATEGEAPAA
jgi:hypothetical protein